MALRARAPATNGRRRDSGQTPARSGGGGSASRRAAAAAGTRRGLPPPAPAPRRPAHREAWLRLLLARGPGTSLLSSPASQARGRAGASRGRLAGLLAGGSGTRNGPDLLSAPCCSCRARKHPGIPEEGGGAAAGPRLAPPPRSRPEARGSAGSGGGSGCSPPGPRPAACRAAAEVSLRRWAAGAPPRSAPPRAAGRPRPAGWPALPGTAAARNAGAPAEGLGWQPAVQASVRPAARSAGQLPPPPCVRGNGSSFESYSACKCFETGTIHLTRVHTVKHNGAFICAGTAVIQQSRKAHRSPGKTRSVRQQEKYELRP